MMKEKYSDVSEFKDDLHKESVVRLVQDMGYVKEDDMFGSKMSCIFHMGDKTPSLQITDDFFRCYGCGARGDIIKFVELKEKISFFEAIKFIADFLNVQLLDANITKEQKMKAKLFAEWKFYQDEFEKRSKTHSILLDIGKSFFPLSVGYDPRMNYIVLPVTSKTGGILGFTKRRIVETDVPKWKHSTLQDSLINLSANVFNLDNAWKDISNKEEVYFVEGPRDVTGMQKAGFANTVGVLGTSNFSERVINILAPVTSFTFVYDGDKAGKHAAISNAIFLIKNRPDIFHKLKIVSLPEGSDPGDLDTQDLRENVSENAQPAMKWFMTHASDDEIASLYQSCASSLLEPKLLHEIANKFNYSLNQTKEWLKFKSKEARNKPFNNKKEHVLSENDLYKERLLSTIGKSHDMDVEPLDMTEDQAKKMLKLRYGIVV